MFDNKKRQLITLLIVAAIIVFWINFLKGKVMSAAAANFGTAMMFIIIVGYGVTIVAFYKASQNFKKTMGLFLFLFLVAGPTLSTSYSYTKEGIVSVYEGNKLQFDLVMGSYVENSFFHCSSYNPTDVYPKCTESQTTIIFHILNELMPIIGIGLLLLLFSSKTAEEIVTNGGAVS